jgi:cytochrome c556
MNRVGWGVVALVAAAFFMGCSRSSQNRSPDEGRAVEGSEWLRGDVETRFALVAKHLRGFDMAMVEVGYRYGELYWASREQNWEYAAYQLGKIETAVANGVERRPLRAASARMFDGVVTQVRAAIDRRDTSALETAIETLTATCNACHQAERVPYIHVAPPGVRLSPVRRGSMPEAERGGSGR